MSTKKVAVLGAGGGIGQPLSMLLKLSPHVDELACYDIVGTPGVAADLSHVSACREMKDLPIPEEIERIFFYFYWAVIIILLYQYSPLFSVHSIHFSNLFLAVFADLHQG
jgi:hypothetical protein